MTDRRTFLSAGAALALSACTTVPLGRDEAVQVAAPKWRVGERWTYHRVDAYNGLDRGTVTRTVESIGAKGIRIVTRRADGAPVEVALYASPGVQISGTLSVDGYVTGTFKPHLLRYDFPLASGERWEQDDMTRIDSNDSYYPLAVSTRVEGWDTVSVAGKSRQAIIVRRTMQLGQVPPYDANLSREELEWYVPEIGSYARLHIFEWEPSLINVEPGYRLHIDLVSYARA